MDRHLPKTCGIHEGGIMKGWLIIVLLIIILYAIDKILCYIYCSLKLIQRNQKNRKMEDAIQSNSNVTINKGIKWRVKQLMYGWIMYTLERLGRVPFQKYRIFILRHIYKMQIADNVVIYHGFHIRAPWNITIGKGTVVGDGVSLDGRNGIIIGENVNISTEVYIYTEQHDTNDPYFDSGDSGGPVRVDNRAWLSSRTTVLPNVTVGEGAVLASGAVAVKNMEGYSVYAGIPAKKVSNRNKDLTYKFTGEFIPFY